MAHLRTLLARGIKVDPDLVKLQPVVVPPPVAGFGLNAAGRTCKLCDRPLWAYQNCPCKREMSRATGRKNAHQSAATRIGVSLSEYEAHIAAGEKRCGGCRAWHPRDAFGMSRGMSDGLNGTCREAIAARRDRRRTAAPGARP